MDRYIRLFKEMGIGRKVKPPRRFRNTDAAIDWIHSLDSDDIIMGDIYDPEEQELIIIEKGTPAGNFDWKSFESEKEEMIAQRSFRWEWDHDREVKSASEFLEYYDVKFDRRFPKIISSKTRGKFDQIDRDNIIQYLDYIREDRSRAGVWDYDFPSKIIGQKRIVVSWEKELTPEEKYNTDMSQIRQKYRDTGKDIAADIVSDGQMEGLNKREIDGRLQSMASDFGNGVVSFPSPDQEDDIAYMRTQGIRDASGVVADHIYDGASEYLNKVMR